jgi:hypothetical protein
MCKNHLIPLKVCWKTHVKRHILCYRSKMKVDSPSITLDSKKDGIMAAVVKLSWLRSRKSLMRNNEGLGTMAYLLIRNHTVD